MIVHIVVFSRKYLVPSLCWPFHGHLWYPPATLSRTASSESLPLVECILPIISSAPIMLTLSQALVISNNLRINFNSQTSFNYQFWSFAQMFLFNLPLWNLMDSLCSESVSSCITKFNNWRVKPGNLSRWYTVWLSVKYTTNVMFLVLVSWQFIVSVEVETVKFDWVGFLFLSAFIFKPNR